MENFITIENSHAVVSIDTIVKFSDNDLSSIQKLIRTHLKKIESLGGFEIPRILNNSKEIDWHKVKLNEESASFLLTLMKNTDNVVQFKFNLIQSFGKMRNEISLLREDAIRIETDNKMRELEEKKDLEIADAIKQAKKRNVYGDGLMSVQGCIAELNLDEKESTVWDALTHAGIAHTIPHISIKRELNENVPSYVGQSKSKYGFPVFYPSIIDSVLKTYVAEGMPEINDKAELYKMFNARIREYIEEM